MMYRNLGRCRDRTHFMIASTKARFMRLKAASRNNLVHDSTTVYIVHHLLIVSMRRTKYCYYWHSVTSTVKYDNAVFVIFFINYSKYDDA